MTHLTIRITLIFLIYQFLNNWASSLYPQQKQTSAFTQFLIKVSKLNPIFLQVCLIKSREQVQKPLLSPVLTSALSKAA